MSIPGQLTSLLHDKDDHCGRVPLYTSASLTVEAAVILPLFLFASLTFVCVIDLCRIQVISQAELTEKVKKLGMYAYTAEDYIQEEYIDQYETKSCTLAVSLIPGYTVDLALRGRVHAWIGRTKDECEADAEKRATEMVYVTDYESVYHTNGSCTHLKLSIYRVDAEELDDIRNESGNRYKACEKCCGAGIDTGYFYIGQNGDRYHISRDCSGLTRKVRLVPKADVLHLMPCSRCG